MPWCACSFHAFRDQVQPHACKDAGADTTTPEQHGEKTPVACLLDSLARTLRSRPARVKTGRSIRSLVAPGDPPVRTRAPLPSTKQVAIVYSGIDNESQSHNKQLDSSSFDNGPACMPTKLLHMSYGRHEVSEEKVREIEDKIADLKARWPPHSVPPSMWRQLEELEAELDEARRREHR